MIYKNALIGGKITDITVRDGKIASLEKTAEDGIDLAGNKVFAGLVDIHAHGCMGIEANSGRIAELSRFEALHGTTSWLPTTATVDIEVIKAALDCVKKAIEFGIPEEDAFIMASRTPARLLNVKKGEIAVGFDADFIVLDSSYNLIKTVIRGNIYE